MGKLPEIIKQTIEVLSDKFGTNGVFLWKAITKQQMIEGILDLTYVLIIAVLFITLIKSWFKKLISKEFDEVGWIPFSIVVIFLGIISGVLLWEGLTKLINPDFAAIDYLLGSIKTK